MLYGFIGCGNMGGALIKALSKSTKDILIADAFKEKAQSVAEENGVSASTVDDVLSSCYRIFLAVKPQQLEALLTESKDVLLKRKPLIISMAAGVSIKKLQGYLDQTLPIIRIMPNTPVSVGAGMIMYAASPLVKDVDSFLYDMRFAGRLDAIDEKLIDAGTAVSGCGPAYMYMFLEALADGGVACGLPRDKALLYAAETMKGAAETVLNTGRHPEELKDAVCSPGGSTVMGVKALEEGGLRSTAINAVCAAFERNKELGK